jgi:hypothetical protein
MTTLPRKPSCRERAQRGLFTGFVVVFCIDGVTGAGEPALQQPGHATTTTTNNNRTNNVVLDH